MPRVSIDLTIGPGARPGLYEEVIQDIMDGKAICNRDTHLIAIKYILRAIDNTLYNWTDVCPECGANHCRREDAKRIIYADECVVAHKQLVPYRLFNTDTERVEAIETISGEEAEKRNAHLEEFGMPHRYVKA